MEMKTCTCCGETKAVSEFGTNGKHNGGYKNQCKKCCAEKLRQWRLENPERARERDRVWAAKNRDRINKKNAKRYVNKNVDEKLNHIFNTALKSCSKRNLEFNINLDYVKELWKSQNGLCGYTKMPLVSQGHQLNTVSLDRKDSDKGYVIGNVHLVCVTVNRMKMALTEEQFFFFCRLVSQNNKIVDNLDNLAVNR